MSPTLVAVACGQPADPDPTPPAVEASSPSAAPSTPGPVATTTTTSSVSLPSASLVVPPWVRWSRPLVATTREGLVALFGGGGDEASQTFYARHVAPGRAAKINQGNPEIAQHDITREACWRGLQSEASGLATEEQRKVCGGQPYMVPIFEGGDVTRAKFCIDQFEFPNRPCELPVVWSGATQAHQVCKKLGKRLCRQEEWMLACEGDPDGGPPQRYAYGDTLDLEVCNTNKRAAMHNDPPCDARTVQTAWETCGTHTEPSGSFPRCRSRFGVYDLHGNVAEAMTRYDAEEGARVSQLKGSAFFYVDVHRRPHEPRARETYVDVCRHDPRWHVQPMHKAWHVNYHLGFRCCLDVPAG
ncbi:MAG: SUMF1/EgtB/PvdO family nonheme iron enzyme [Myxococcota bacterium]